jgi:hypothetical protein
MKCYCNTLYLFSVMTRLPVGLSGFNSRQRQGLSSGFGGSHWDHMHSRFKADPHLHVVLRLKTGHILSSIRLPVFTIVWHISGIELWVTRTSWEDMTRHGTMHPFVPDSLVFPPQLQFIISFLFFVRIRRKRRKTFLIIQKHGKRADCIKEVESFGILQLESYALILFPLDVTHNHLLTLVYYKFCRDLLVNCHFLLLWKFCGETRYSLISLVVVSWSVHRAVWGQQVSSPHFAAANDNWLHSLPHSKACKKYCGR